MPLFSADEDDLARKLREVDTLRVEYRRVQGRINYRVRRGRMFLGFLVLTIAAIVAVAVFTLQPDQWAMSQQSRFTQMTTLLLMLVGATPLAAYFTRRFDRQRERVRIAKQRHHEILKRLSQLDEATGRRRRRRRKKRSWVWRIANPKPFARPPLETMSNDTLEDAADALSTQLVEERGMRALAYLHAGIIGGATIIVAFYFTAAGPEYLRNFLFGPQSHGALGPDPLVFWLTLTVMLVMIGGLGSHRVTVLLRHARGYQDRLASIERALWDARVLLRERREKV